VIDLAERVRDFPSSPGRIPDSAQRNVAAALDASAFHKRIVERMAEGVSLANEDGIILYTNPAEDRMFGYEPGELLGRHVTALNALPPEENARVVAEVMAQVRATGESNGEFRNLRKDGTPFTTYARITSVELGGRTHFVWVQEDVTERKRAHERTARLQSLSAALSRAVTLGDVAEAAVTAGMAAASARTGGLWRLSGDGRFAELLASACYPDEAVERLRRLPLEGSVAAIPILEAIRSGEPVWMESRAELREPVESVGGEIPLDQSFACLPLVVERRTVGGIAFTFPRIHGFDEDDRVLLVVLARQCALALERARLYDEAQLANQRSAFLARASEILSSSLDYERTLEALTRLAVPSIADCCAVDMVGDGGSIHRISAAHADPTSEQVASEFHRRYPIRIDAPSGVGKVIRTGVPELLEDIVREPPAEGSPGVTHQQVEMQALGIRSYLSVALKARGRVLGALTLVHASSGRRYTEADLPLAEDIARRAAIAVDNALLYREAQTQMRNAEEASRAKDEFLATVSHELRTPLTSILGWTQILRAQRTVTPGKIERALQTIERNARAQAQLIEDLLDVSRIIQGKMRLEVVRVDPSMVIEAALESVRPAAEAKEIRLETRLEPNAGTIQGDPSRIQQVVWNLLTNAIKFTPRTGQIRVALERVGGEIEISVTDTGRGIPLEFLPHVFERFRQADARPTRATGGLGLGLAIVRHLAELHGGWVRAESDGEGKGATFRVRLPASSRSAEDPNSLIAGWMPPPTRAAPTPPSFERPPALAGATVLVVDDEHDTLEFIRAVLEECRAKVVTADCAKDGLRLVEDVRPHVLISDIGMPGEDGIQLLTKVRALPREKGGRVPAVALTAFARAEDRARIMLSGFQMHVPKPVEAAELVAVVAALSKRSARR
jgi:PAS domain S-box-containing protein